MGIGSQWVKWGFEFHAARGVTRVENWVREFEGLEKARRLLEKLDQMRAESGESVEAEELTSVVMDHLRKGSGG